jgi:hypothetical protein
VPDVYLTHFEELASVSMPHVVLMLALKPVVHEMDGFSKKVMHTVFFHFSQQLTLTISLSKCLPNLLERD